MGKDVISRSVGQPAGEGDGGVEGHAVKPDLTVCVNSGHGPHDPAVSGGSSASVGPVNPKDDREKFGVPRDAQPIVPMSASSADAQDTETATTAQRKGAGIKPGPSPDPTPHPAGPAWALPGCEWCHGSGIITIAGIDGLNPCPCTLLTAEQMKQLYSPAPATSAPTGDGGAQRDAIGECADSWHDATVSVFRRCQTCLGEWKRPPLYDGNGELLAPLTPSLTSSIVEEEAGELGGPQAAAAVWLPDGTYRAGKLVPPPPAPAQDEVERVQRAIEQAWITHGSETSGLARAAIAALRQDVAGGAGETMDRIADLERERSALSSQAETLTRERDGLQHKIETERLEGNAIIAQYKRETEAAEAQIAPLRAIRENIVVDKLRSGALLVSIPNEKKMLADIAALDALNTGGTDG